MTPFTLGELQRLRELRRLGTKMKRICALMHNHTRDEIVDAIDSLIRNPSNHDAQKHILRVMAFQAAREPLINGKPATQVEGGRRPMF